MGDLNPIYRLSLSGRIPRIIDAAVVEARDEGPFMGGGEFSLATLYGNGAPNSNNTRACNPDVSRVLDSRQDLVLELGLALRRQEANSPGARGDGDRQKWELWSSAQASTGSCALSKIPLCC